jgi:hypothetical protein
MKTTIPTIAGIDTIGNGFCLVLATALEAAAGNSSDYELFLGETPDTVDAATVLVHLTGPGVAAQLVLAVPLATIVGTSFDKTLIVGGFIELAKDGDKIDDDLRLLLEEIGLETGTMTMLGLSHTDGKVGYDMAEIDEALEVQLLQILPKVVSHVLVLGERAFADKADNCLYEVGELLGLSSDVHAGSIVADALAAEVIAIA